MLYAGRPWSTVARGSSVSSTAAHRTWPSRLRLPVLHGKQRPRPVLGSLAPGAAVALLLRRIGRRGATGPPAGSRAAPVGAATVQRERRGALPKWAIRVLVGLVLGEIMGPATFAGGWPFVLAYGAVVYLMSSEYHNILEKVLDPPPVPALRWSLWAVSICTLLAAHFGVMTGIFETTSITMLMLLLLLQGNVALSNGNPPIQFNHIASQVFGVYYVGYLPAFWVRLRAISVPLARPPSVLLTKIVQTLHWPMAYTVGAAVTVSCVLCIVAADSFAYFGGRKWGRHPLIIISPKKTVEGAYCGLLGSVGMALLCNWGWGFPGNVAASVFVGGAIFFASLLGDLVVSAMKRNAQIKDAGKLLPGHGGLIDRFDSYFFAAPTAYFCWYYYLKLQGVHLTPMIRVPMAV